MNRNPEWNADTGSTGEEGHKFPDELVHLEGTMLALAAALGQSSQAVERYDREYREHQRYIVQSRHEIDPKEIFQSALSLADMDKAGAREVRFRDQIARLMDSPYFARIDFRAQAEEIPDTVYIGPFSFSEDDAYAIYDWRAPISSMFYNCDTGAASYHAPSGLVEGTLTRKRQFRIQGGKMRYCLESDVSIRDDVLEQELSRSADTGMKTIIATIQREQNEIIRNEQADVLIIQGVAGSGKTSIALHRIAYLLFRQKDRLTARNVLILSPNRVFGDYISNVLPELGEEAIYGMGFEDLARIQLDGIIDFTPATDPTECADEELAQRIRFKSTAGFLEKVEAYLEMAAEQYFVAEDYHFGDFTAPGEYIRDRYRAYRKYPVKQRMLHVAEDILTLFQDHNHFEEDLPKLRTVAKHLAAMFPFKNTLSLYRDFYRWLECPDLLRMADKQILEWWDVYPFLRFHAAFAGLKENRLIRHLVVDEMQDYTPTQYAVLGILFRCNKTILGDFHQVINPHHAFSLDDFHRVYPGAKIVRLTASYRSTYEIMVFAKALLGTADIQPIKRHGDRVEVVCCGDAEDEMAVVKTALADFTQSDATTMGILLKTAEQARNLYEKLQDFHPVNLLGRDSASFSGGASITWIGMSKGLEFDRVLIPHVNEKTYGDPFDRNLLYIACTRAMHKLTLTYFGQPAEAIAGINLPPC